MNPLLQKFEMMDDAMADILRQKTPAGECGSLPV
jgi:hypothetical protein